LLALILSGNSPDFYILQGDNKRLPNINS